MTAPRYSLLGPKLDLPQPGSPEPSGRGGTRPQGEGAGESGKLLDGQAPIPIETTDTRYTAYFLELKKRIEAKWTYPDKAVRQHQTGRGVVGFVLRKDGSLSLVEVLDSSGVEILDQNIEIAIKFAGPFPPIPWNIGEDRIAISVHFTYILGGFRVFGFQ